MRPKPFGIRSLSSYNIDADANFWCVLVDFPGRAPVGAYVRLDGQGNPQPDELAKAFRELAEKIDGMG